MSTPSAESSISDVPKSFPTNLDIAARIARTLLDPILILDVAGIIRHTNQAMGHILHTEHHLLIGKPVADVIAPQSWPAFVSVREQAQEQPGVTQTGDIFLQGNAKPLSQLRYTLIALGDAPASVFVIIGRPMQELLELTSELVSLNEDLVDQNRSLTHSNQQLSRERTHLAQLNQLARRLSQSLDLNQVLQDAVQSTIEMFGAQAGSLILLGDDGAPGHWFVSSGVPEPAQDVLTVALNEGPQGNALRQKRTFCIADYSLAYPASPTLLPGRAFLIAPLLTTNDALGVLTLAHPQTNTFNPDDEMALAAATETIALSIQNAQLYTRLREAEAAREHMSNLLVHDIRSPLMATFASIEIVKRTLINHPVYPQIQDSLESGMRTVRTVVDLTNDLLDVKRLQSDYYTLDRQSLDVSSLYEDVGRMMQILATQNELTLQSKVAAATPDISGDERLLRRVLVNILANALRFSPRGGAVTMLASPARHSPDSPIMQPHGVLLVVEDQGPGVAPADRERIFRPFIQGNGESHRGTGLGLAFCREVVVAHAGQIWVEDRPGGGSRFCIWLPAV